MVAMKKLLLAMFALAILTACNSEAPKTAEAPPGAPETGKRGKPP